MDTFKIVCLVSTAFSVCCIAGYKLADRIYNCGFIDGSGATLKTFINNDNIKFDDQDDTISNPA